MVSDVSKLEMVQHRFTRNIPTVNEITYEDILIILGLTSLIIIAVGRMRQILPSFPVLLYGVSPYNSL